MALALGCSRPRMTTVPPHVRLTHFGAVRGLNTFEHHRGLGVQPGGADHPIQVDHQPAAISRCDGRGISGSRILMQKAASAAQVGFRQRSATDDDGARVALEPPQQPGQLNDVAGLGRIESEEALVAIARLPHPAVSSRGETLGRDPAARGTQDREPASCRCGGVLRRGRLHAYATLPRGRTRANNACSASRTACRDD